MLTPDLEKLASVVDPETGMSPWEAADDIPIGCDIHAVLSDAFEGGAVAEAAIEYDNSAFAKACVATLRHWHARQRQTWRKVKDETPPEGVYVLVHQNGWLGDPVLCASRDGYWCDNVPIGFNPPVRPDDYWMPIAPPPARRKKSKLT